MQGTAKQVQIMTDDTHRQSVQVSRSLTKFANLSRQVPIPLETISESTAADLEFVQFATTDAAAIAKTIKW